jgi:5-methylcytosine-specific restriction endonuclease McrA
MADGRQTPIEEVCVGDRVIDAFGDVQTVVANGRRVVNKVVRVKHRGSFESTVTTPEHPFLNEKRVFVAIGDKPEYLLFPRRISTVRYESTFDVSAVLPSDKWLRLKNGRVYWSRRRTEDGFPMTLGTSDELSELLGLYVAEGYSSATTVSWCFGDHEKDTLAARTASLIKRLFGLEVSVDLNPEAHKCVVRVSNKVLALVMRALCGHLAQNKKTPWALLGTDVKPYLKGLINGDACIDTERRKIALGMTSYDAIFGAQSLLWSCGIYPTVNMVEVPGKQPAWYLFLQGENYSKCMSEILGRPDGVGERVFGNDDFVFRKLQDLEAIEEDTVVYNLETSGSHSYIANGLSVHNCQYCGVKLPMRQLNYDHVTPRVRGGKTVWENIVTSCYPCNDKKGHRTLEQAGMKLRRPPYRPKTLPMTNPLLGMQNIPALWQPYVQGFTINLVSA